MVLRDHVRAAVWFQRAAGLAARQEDWKTYLDAHLGYGEALQTQGDLAAARQWIGRAVRRSRRQGLRSYEERAMRASDTLDALELNEVL